MHAQQNIKKKNEICSNLLTTKIICIVYEDTVRMSQKALCASITKTGH